MKPLPLSHLGPAVRRCLSAVVPLMIALVASGCDSLVPAALDLSLDGAEVVETSVDDGLVQAGEAVRLDLYVTNTSQTAYEDLALDASSAGSVAGLEAWFPGQFLLLRVVPRIGPGETVRLVVRFTVDPNTPAGTAVPYEVTLMQADGVSATVSGEIRTSALPYSPTVALATVVDDTDGDGVPEPGEEVAVRFQIDPRHEPGVSLCVGHLVSAPMPQVTLLGIIGGICDGSRTRHFRFRASSLLPPGTEIRFVVRLHDVLGNTWDTAVPIVLR